MVLTGAAVDPAERCLLYTGVADAAFDSKVRLGRNRRPRKRGADPLSESGIRWMNSLSTQRQCDVTLLPGRGALRGDAVAGRGLRARRGLAAPAAPAAAVARVPGRLACPALEPKALAAYITYLPRKTKAGPTLCAGCMSVTPNVSVCVITENPNCGIPVVRTTLSCLSNSDRLEFHRH
jgi:hypothetical protein